MATSQLLKAQRAPMRPARSAVKAFAVQQAPKASGEGISLL